jgi:ribosome-associated protein
MDDPMPVGRGLAIPLAEVDLRASRSSGPGGQHANVTASRIEAVFDVDDSRSLGAAEKERLKARCGPRVTAVAQDARSQARNRELALQRLQDRVARGLEVPKKRRSTKPSRAARARRLDKKRQRGQRKRERGRPGWDD